MPDNKYLVTPDSHQGVSHITPARLATLHRGTIAQNDYVLSVGQKFKTEIISNNVVRVYDGALIQGGIRGEIEQGDYRDVEISNGIIGMKRNYLIVCRWSVDNEDGRKTHQEIVAVEGAATEGEPQDPETNTNLIEEGAQIHDTVLYRVVKEGLDIVKIDPLFKVLMNVEELMEMQREINSKSIFESGTSGNWKYNKWSNGDVELWYEGILPFANKTDAGLSGIFMTIANVSLPFQIKNGVTFASLKWAYTEWCTSYLINDNRVQIRKFSNANSAGVTDQRCAIYVKGKY